MQHKLKAFLVLEQELRTLRSRLKRIHQAAFLADQNFPELPIVEERGKMTDRPDRPATLRSLANA